MPRIKQSLDLSMHRDYEVCCDDFSQAFSPGTDNEGYGPLLEIRVGNDRVDRVLVGYSIKPVKHCPWCGATGKKMFRPAKQMEM